MQTETRGEQLTTSIIRTILKKVRIDIPLFIVLFFTCTLSFFILCSAEQQDTEILMRQIVHTSFAFVLMIILAHVNPNKFRMYSIQLYILGIILLLAVFFIGETINGAKRWLYLGFFHFQPSEMIKITTPMVVALFLSEHTLPAKPKQIFIVALFIIIPTILIAKQPDLGTALLVASSGISVLFFAGLSWRFMLISGLILASSTPILWYFMLDYQRDRVLTFLNPEINHLDNGYHIIQSKIAIGSGGIYGRGWLNGTQARLDFLPESSTDFIFSVLAEEFGLLGCVGLLTLYLLIIGRCLYISTRIQDTYRRLLSASLACTFFIYVFVNIGMVIGILPVVGVPLPLISYGGTSTVTLLSGFGILMSVCNKNKFSSA